MEKRRNRKFSDEFKLLQVSQILSGEKSKHQVCKENSLSSSVLQYWILKFAPPRTEKGIEMGDESAEKEELAFLRKRLEESEKELKRERMRADFYQTMVEVAEEELHIPIRKKAGAKR